MLSDRDLGVSKFKGAVNSLPRAVYQITPAAKNGSFLCFPVCVPRAVFQPVTELSLSLLSLLIIQSPRVH